MNYSINVARITEIHLSENETISTFHTLYQDEFQMDQRFKCIYKKKVLDKPWESWNFRIEKAILTENQKAIKD